MSIPELTPMLLFTTANGICPSIRVDPSTSPILGVHEAPASACEQSNSGNQRGSKEERVRE